MKMKGKKINQFKWVANALKAVEPVFGAVVSLKCSLK